MPTRCAWVLMLLVFALIWLCVPGYASEVMVSALATEYGAWSAWQIDPIEPKPNTEIEQAERAISEETALWRYTRFEYVNEAKGSVFISPIELNGAHVRPGSGRWRINEVNEPLEVTGQENGFDLYEGGWFNEEVVRTSDVYTQVMYRSRVVKRVTCEVSTNELLLFPGDTRKLTVNTFDGSSGYQWECSDTNIATVDSSGNVTGKAVGAARVHVRSSAGRVVTIEVYVCDQTASIPDGLYSLRLHKTNKALTVGRSLGKSSYNVGAVEFTGERKQRFIVNNVGERTFTLHPLERRKTMVDIARKKNKIGVGANIQTHSKRDRTSQYFRTVYVPDGSYIIYPKADPNLIISADAVDGSANVRLGPNGDMETLDRWVFIKADAQTGPVAPFAQPVARDGVSYVMSEFSEANGKESMTLGSNGRRVYVLSAAKGTVTQAYDGCVHDEPSTPDAAGRLVDPCNLDGQSLGNYVEIDHGGGVKVVYAHLSDIFVEEGDAVRQGSMIGRSGATGSAGQVALDLTMTVDDKPIDPRGYIKLPELGLPIE